MSEILNDLKSSEMREGSPDQEQTESVNKSPEAELVNPKPPNPQKGPFWRGWFKKDNRKEEVIEEGIKINQKIINDAEQRIRQVFPLSRPGDSGYFSEIKKINIIFKSFADAVEKSNNQITITQKKLWSLFFTKIPSCSEINKLDKENFKRVYQDKKVIENLDDVIKEVSETFTKSKLEKRQPRDYGA